METEDTVNSQVTQTVNAYLDYCARLIESMMEAKSYSTDKLRQLGDDLVLTPDELVELVNKLQVAYSEI